MALKMMLEFDNFGDNAGILTILKMMLMMDFEKIDDDAGF